MAFSDDGYEICRGLIARDKIESIRRKMLAIMAPFCDYPLDRSDSLDKYFVEISGRRQDLRSNVYKLFGRLADLPLLLSDEKICGVLEGLGFSVYTIQAYAIFCLEPYNERHLFVPHQDLKDRTSLNSLIIWVPLSSGRYLGGIAYYPGSHKKGPIRHELSPSGQLQLPESAYRGHEKVSLTDFEIGDCLFLSPYLIHESVINAGERIRWTAVVKIDDAIGITHVVDSLHPFVVTAYIDTRSNEERVREAEFKRRKPST